MDILRSEGLHLTGSNRTRLPDNRKVLMPYQGPIDELLQETTTTYKDSNVTDEADVSVATNFNALTSDQGIDQTVPNPNIIYINFDFELYDKRYNKVEAICSVKEKLSEYYESMAQLMQRLSKILYENLVPAYGWVDLTVSVAGERLIGESILARKMNTIYWVNFFGGPYVERYGLDYLMNAPGWKKEILSDGGVMLQLSPKFTIEAEGPDPVEVLEYFGPSGVIKVTWPAHPLIDTWERWEPQDW